jgi:hypothetical protein
VKSFVKSKGSEVLVAEGMKFHRLIKAMRRTQHFRKRCLGSCVTAEDLRRFSVLLFIPDDRNPGRHR